MSDYKIPRFYFEFPVNSIRVGLNSFGTIHGTLGTYNDSGVYLGNMNINGYGIFFSVRESLGGLGNARQIIRKSIGTGISISSLSNGSNGLFDIILDPIDTNFAPREYGFELFVCPTGASFVDGTTRLKSIGSGIFEILSGAKYGTV